MGRTQESCSVVAELPVSHPAETGLDMVRNSNLSIQCREMRCVLKEAGASWGMLSMKWVIRVFGVSSWCSSWTYMLQLALSWSANIWSFAVAEHGLHFVNFGDVLRFVVAGYARRGSLGFLSFRLAYPVCHWVHSLKDFQVTAVEAKQIMLPWQRVWPYQSVAASYCQQFRQEPPGRLTIPTIPR